MPRKGGKGAQKNNKAVARANHAADIQILARNLGLALVPASPFSVPNAPNGSSSTVILAGPPLDERKPVPHAKLLKSWEFSTIPVYEQRLALLRAQLAQQQLNLAALKAQNCDRKIADKLRGDIIALELQIEEQRRKLAVKTARRDKELRQRHAQSLALTFNDPRAAKKEQKIQQPVQHPDSRQSGWYEAQKHEFVPGAPPLGSVRPAKLSNEQSAASRSLYAIPEFPRNRVQTSIYGSHKVEGSTERPGTSVVNDTIFGPYNFSSVTRPFAFSSTTSPFVLKSTTSPVKNRTAGNSAKDTAICSVGDINLGPAAQYGISSASAPTSFGFGPAASTSVSKPATYTVGNRHVEKPAVDSATLSTGSIGVSKPKVSSGSSPRGHQDGKSHAVKPTTSHPGHHGINASSAGLASSAAGYQTAEGPGLKPPAHWNRYGYKDLDKPPSDLTASLSLRYSESPVMRVREAPVFTVPDSTDDGESDDEVQILYVRPVNSKFCNQHLSSGKRVPSNGSGTKTSDSSVLKNKAACNKEANGQSLYNNVSVDKGTHSNDSSGNGSSTKGLVEKLSSDGASFRNASNTKGPVVHPSFGNSTFGSLASFGNRSTGNRSLGNSSLGNNSASGSLQPSLSSFSNMSFGYGGSVPTWEPWFPMSNTANTSFGNAVFSGSVSSGHRTFGSQWEAMQPRGLKRGRSSSSDAESPEQPRRKAPRGVGADSREIVEVSEDN
ncbi:hypothetical protein B0T17DRAFT_618321 [Bombardia bombarda]|uniref:Uncharacterized protein n=1 Tax=Bombardia bombarda TaxID=252184 RepID=A0AA39WUS9_9PEZI|nr:hypothetical protein B0T17DRAFT_618321 [Bombardia bombarda]